MNSRASIMAGCMIGLAAVLSCCIENTILAALFFSIGLLYIRISKLNLFTGQIQNLKNFSVSFPQLLSCLIWNICGVTLLFSIMFSFDFPAAADKYFTITVLKWSHPWYHYITSGMCCGALMTIATKKESPLWLSVLCVMAFILAGFNHCIADWFYIFGSSDPIKYLYWFLIVIGNFLGGYLAATK